VVPPDFRRPLRYARDGQRALDLLFDDCAADAACARAFPNVRAELAALLARLDRERVILRVRHPVSGDSISVELTHAGVADGLWSTLMVPERARRIPLAVHHAARGDHGTLLDLLVAQEPPRRRYHNAAHLSVVCPEEVQHVSAKAIDSAYAGTFMPAERAHEYLRACELWGLPTAPASTLAPVRVAIPTLIVSGEMDPVTPPALGAHVARSLPRARHVVSRALSHEADGVIGAECLDSLSLRFVARPDPDALDVRCVARMRAPAFALPEKRTP
jgi:pimeloyl-ACP methyl ester carboxylesterase